MCKREKIGLAILILMTLLSGAIGMGIDHIIVGQPKGNSLGIGFWLVAPLLTGIMIRIINRDWKGFGIKPRIKQNIGWYLVALLVYPILTLIVILIGAACGVIILGKIEFDVMLSLFMSSFIGAFIKNIFEEFAWRGNLVPFLERTKLGDLGLYLCVGMIWAGWHILYYMYFLPDSIFVDTTRELMTIVGCLTVILITPLFVEIYRMTHSVWPGLILHAMINVVESMLSSQPQMMTIAKKGQFFFDPISGVMMMALMLAMGIGLRFYRVSKENKVIEAEL